LKNLIAINIIISFFFFSSCDSKSVNSLKKNHDNYSKELLELKEYFNKIVPNDFLVRIQYNSSNNIDLFVYHSFENSENRVKIFGEWKVKLDDSENAEFIALVNNKLNWNRDTFKELYSKLNNANCIGICNRNPVEIEYGFMGMGLLSYLVFDENLTPEQQEAYSDDCMQIFYKENIVLLYGSGATGSFCTSEFKRKK